MRKLMEQRRTVVLLAAALVLAFHSNAARAEDATSFNPLTVSVEAQAISGVPVGTIIAWPVSNNPEGWAEGNWLECNGQSISPTVYPELFAVIGNRVPDLRGLFLRGQGGNSAALGAVQGDAIRNITGTFHADIAMIQFAGIWETGAFTDEGALYDGDGGGNANETRLYRFDASRVVPTANENRPINRAVRYLIRARA